MQILTLFSLITILAVIGCDDDNGTDSESPGGSIMPLAVGNRWDFDKHTFPPGGGTPVVTDDSIVITGTQQVGGETRFVANVTEQFVNRGSGLWYQPTGASGPYLLLAYPADVGSTWWSGPSGQILMTLLRKDVSVTVVAGTYQCYKYLAEYPAGSGRGLRYYWAAPNVGIIRYEVRDSSGLNVEEMLELADVELQ
ncbi:hypothetical protein GF377_01725 [candidate division GN15 bacterium]|nr:hypothetical protein [candidate division GN15 bacterium]